MKKLILVLTLLNFISLKTTAQDFYADSLSKAASNSKIDEKKVKNFIELAKYQQTFLLNYDTALIVLNTALTIAEQNKLYTLQAEIMYLQAISFGNTIKFTQKYTLVQRAILFCRQHQLKASEADLLLLLSKVISDKNDSVKLIIDQSLNISLQNNLIDQQINALAAKANFVAAKQPDSAKALFALALSLSRQHQLHKSEVTLLQTIAKTYSLNHWGDSATFIMQNAMNTAHEYGLVNEEIISLNALILSEQGYFIRDSLNTYFERLLSLCQKYKRDSAVFMQASTLSYQDIGNYPKALQISIALLQLHKSKNDSTNIQIDLYQIALSNNYSLQYKKAIAWYNEAKKYSQQSFHYIFIHDDLAHCYLELNQKDSAKYYADSCYKIATAFYGSEANIYGGVLNDLGTTYLALGEDSLALDYLRRSYIFFTTKSIEYQNYTGSTQGLADYYKKHGNLDSSYYYARLSLNTARDKGFLKFIFSSSAIVSDYFLKHHNADSAYYFQQVGFDAYKTLYNHESTSEFQNLAFVEQQKEQNLAVEKKLAEDQYASNLKLYGLLSLLALGIIIGVIVYRNNRNRQRSYDLLKKQKSEIDLQKAKLEDSIKDLRATQTQLVQSEKMASLGELTAGIAHEIQNPLNFVNNFSEVNKELISELVEEVDKGNTEEVKTLANNIKENSEKINHHGKRADAIVKGMLQHSQSTKGKKEPTDINALCDEYLRLSYHGLRAKDKSFNATMKTDFDHSIGNINIIPQDIGRVILNLINNAFYAVAEKKKVADETYEPTVSIKTLHLSSPSGVRGISISVTDNGNGISQSIVEKIFQPFFTTKPTGQGTGLGLSLSYDIIKAHGGEIKVESKEGDGTTFIIQIPEAK
ncbi:MAG: ATP-binding protein [Ferruginibacter sp.]